MSDVRQIINIWFTNESTVTTYNLLDEKQINIY